MGSKSFVSILCFLVISFSPITVSAQDCDGAAGTFKPNSPYESNRRLMNSTLASNVTAHDGYFNGSIGLGPDRVYALGMCAPGAEPHACSSCIQAASNSSLQSCSSQTDSSAWSGEKILCLVRYSSKPFSGVLLLEPSTEYPNEKEIEKENQKEFDSVWDALIFRMIPRATSSSSKYYAKDAVLVPVYGRILALMQCTLDISSEDCKFCLERSVDTYKQKYHEKKGAIILRPSCFFRWELYTFSGVFDIINDSPPPSLRPSSPPSNRPSLTNITTKGKSLSKHFCFVFWILCS